MPGATTWAGRCGSDLDVVTHELRRVDRECGRPHDAGAERVTKRVLEALAIVNGRFRRIAATGSDCSEPGGFTSACSGCGSREKSARSCIESTTGTRGPSVSALIPISDESATSDRPAAFST